MTFFIKLYKMLRSIGAERSSKVSAQVKRMAQTVTRSDLGEAIHQEIGLSRSASAGLVKDVLDQISTALVTGANVEISSFGNFVLRDKRQRVGRNPKTGVIVQIEPRTVLTFRPSATFRERINVTSTERHEKAEHLGVQSAASA